MTKLSGLPHICVPVTISFGLLLNIMWMKYMRCIILSCLFYYILCLLDSSLGLHTDLVCSFSLNIVTHCIGEKLYSFYYRYWSCFSFFGHYWNENGAMNIFVNITYPISTHTSLEYFLGNGTAKFIKYVALICLILDNVKTFFKVLFIFEQHRFKLCRPTQMSFPINTV